MVVSSHVNIDLKSPHRLRKDTTHNERVYCMYQTCPSSHGPKPSIGQANNTRAKNTTSISQKSQFERLCVQY